MASHAAAAAPGAAGGPGQDAERLLAILDGFRQSKVLFAAVELGVYETLADKGPQTLDQLTSSLQLHRDALGRLLDANVALATLTVEGEAYALSAVGRQYLVRSSPASIVGYVLHSERLLFPLWTGLQGAVREGTTRWQAQLGCSSEEAFANYYAKAEDREQFVYGMHSFGQMTSPAIATAFDLTPHKTFVDLGGASGHLALACLDRWDHLEKATIADLARVLETSRAFVERAPPARQAKMALAPVDFFSGDPLPAGDCYGLSRILHDWDDDTALMILKKVHAALPAGGGLLLAEMVLAEDAREGPLRARLQDINMLVQTGGRERRFSEFVRLLEAADFADAQVKLTGGYLDAIYARKA